LFLDWLSGAKFGLGVLKEVSGRLSKEERKVTISVENKSGYKWKAINAYLKHGTSDLALPYEVPKGKINVNITEKFESLSFSTLFFSIRIYFLRKNL